MEVVDNCFRFKKDEKWGLKNKSRNKIIFEPLYDDIRRIRGTDFHLKMKRNKKWGIVDCDGNYVSDFRFDDILGFEGQCFIVILDGKTVKIRLSSERKRSTKSSKLSLARSDSTLNPSILPKIDGGKVNASVSPYSSASSLAHRYTPDKLPTQSTISSRFAKRRRGRK